MFNGYIISVGEDEKVLEMDGSDGCTTVWMYLLPVKYSLKMVKRVIFMLCIYNHHKQDTFSS